MFRKHPAGSSALASPSPRLTIATIASIFPSFDHPLAGLDLLRIPEAFHTPHMTKQTEQVVALLKAIETGNPAPVAVINPNKYIQHNLGAADGLAGFGSLLQALPKGSAKVNTLRVFLHFC